MCTVKAGSQSNTLWQRFVETGPIALLAMWENYYSLIWTVPENLHDYLMALDDTRFVDDLNNELFDPPKNPISQEFVSAFSAKQFITPPLVSEISNKRLSFPLFNLNAQRYIGQNIA